MVVLQNTCVDAVTAHAQFATLYRYDGFHNLKSGKF